MSPRSVTQESVVAFVNALYKAMHTVNKVEVDSVCGCKLKVEEI